MPEEIRCKYCGSSEVVLQFINGDYCCQMSYQKCPGFSERIKMGLKERKEKDIQFAIDEHDKALLESSHTT